MFTRFERPAHSIRRITVSVPRVTVRGNSQVVLSFRLYELLGKPEAVIIMKENSGRIRRWGITVGAPLDTDAYMVKGVNKGEAIPGKKPYILAHDFLHTNIGARMLPGVYDAVQTDQGNVFELVRNYEVKRSYN